MEMQTEGTTADLHTNWRNTGHGWRRPANVSTSTYLCRLHGDEQITIELTVDGAAAFDFEFGSSEKVMDEFTQK